MMLIDLVWPLPIVQILGSSSLPVYELDRRNVMRRDGRLRPFENPRGFTGDPRCPAEGVAPRRLRFSAWRLAHAVTKADFLRRLPFQFLYPVGFLLQQVGTLDWRQDPLRLFRDVTRGYTDFVGTSLAGRIGQGVAILLMEGEDYSFIGPYPRRSNESGPDFLFEHRGRTRALIEAKGSFVEPGSGPNIKRKLQEAIRELSASRRLVHQKSYAIATCLREVDDTHIEPSLVAFVDPDRAGGTDEYDSDWVRRQNYAAWLDRMGLFAAASDLRSRRRPTGERSFALPTIQLAERRFAVAVTSIRPKSVLSTQPFRPGPWPLADGLVLDVAGIEIENLRVIERALADRSATALFEIQPWRSNGAPSVDELEGFRGSALSDGTLLGEIDAWMLPSLTQETVSL